MNQRQDIESKLVAKYPAMQFQIINVCDLTQSKQQELLKWFKTGMTKVDYNKAKKLIEIHGQY